MSKINTGGSAFPRAGNEWADMAWVEAPAEQGMTLRDYFAAKAMQAFLSNDNLLRASCEWHADGSETSIAVLAYDQADAMLKARK
jgi:hypothetical protein